MTYTMDKVASAYKSAMEKDALLTPAPLIAGISKKVSPLAVTARNAVAKADPLAAAAAGEKSYLQGVVAPHRPIVTGPIAAPAVPASAQSGGGRLIPRPTAPVRPPGARLIPRPAAQVGA